MMSNQERKKQINYIDWTSYKIQWDRLTGWKEIEHFYIYYAAVKKDLWNSLRKFVPPSTCFGWATWRLLVVLNLRDLSLPVVWTGYSSGERVWKFLNLLSSFPSASINEMNTPKSCNMDRPTHSEPKTVPENLSILALLMMNRSCSNPTLCGFGLILVMH